MRTGKGYTGASVLSGDLVGNVGEGMGGSGCEVLIVVDGGGGDEGEAVAVFGGWRCW